MIIRRYIWHQGTGSWQATDQITGFPMKIELFSYNKRFLFLHHRR
jgi:hypothetical protein